MTLEITYDYEIEISNHLIEVTVQAGVEHQIDSNYGADADGNRGMRVEFADLDWIEILDKRGNDITDKIELKYKKEFEYICNEAIHNAIDEHNFQTQYELDCYNDHKYNEYKDSRRGIK